MGIDQTTIGRRLKEARTNCGLTQEAAAEAVGIARTAVVNIEAGKRSLSTLELSQFAKLYHRPVTYFFEADDASLVEPADLILARLPRQPARQGCRRVVLGTLSHRHRA